MENTVILKISGMIQWQTADVFRTLTDNVGLHLRNICADSEPQKIVTAENFSLVQTEAMRKVRRRIRYYNLDAVISVGYRVVSTDVVLGGITFAIETTGVTP